MFFFVSLPSFFRMARRLVTVALALPAVGGAVAQPPVMGWSSWNTYRVHISDSLIRRQAQAMVANGMKAAGYRYVNIDDGYLGGRRPDGSLRAHPQRFPHGLRATVDYIHALGLRAGCYSDAGVSTCGHFWDADSLGAATGFYGHDAEDARFLFNGCGFDFIKIDFCGGDAGQNALGLELDERERYTAIHRAILATGRRDVRVNVCRWAFPGTWVRGVADSWRIAPDIRPDWASVKAIIHRNKYLSAYAGAGKYNDMDMLEIGRGLTAAEERTHFGMWCALSSPLLVGCDLTAVPPASLALLTNPELIAVNQDSLSLQAALVDERDGLLVFAKDVGRRYGTERVVAVCNLADTARRLRLPLARLELAGRTRVRDLFARADLPQLTGGFLDLTLAAHDMALLRLSARRRLTPAVYEAENAWLEAFQDLGVNPATGHARAVADASCSAGGKVEWLGLVPGNYLEWRDVRVPRPGRYRLVVSCVSPEARPLCCSVNGAELPVRQCPASPAAGRAAVAFEAFLREGSNVVRLYHPSARCPDIDCLTVAPSAR